MTHYAWGVYMYLLLIRSPIPVHSKDRYSTCTYYLHEATKPMVIPNPLRVCVFPPLTYWANIDT